MTQQQSQRIEEALADFSVEDKLELVARLVQGIRTDVSAAPERTRVQHQALDALLRRLDAMPTATVADGLSNRDHDRILHEVELPSKRHTDVAEPRCVRMMSPRLVHSKFVDDFSTELDRKEN